MIGMTLTANMLGIKVPEGYITGLGRDYPHPPRAHLYKGTFGDPGLPMCRRGWNRDQGQSYSIWRNNVGERGVCKVCLRRAARGLEGVAPRKSSPTGSTPEADPEATAEALKKARGA